MLACANQKGGVGKTTTVVNLAAYLAGDGRRVLVVDLDPQGNATSGLGAGRAASGASVYDALMGGADLGAFIVPTVTPGLSLVPSSIALAGAEVELAGMPQRERRLKRVIAAVRADWDLVFIDCPPSLGLLTVNALTAADAVLIPMQCEYYALEGLSQLIATIHLVRDHLNPALAVQGVVLTMFDARTNLSAEVAAEVRGHLGSAVFETVVPRSVRLAEAPSHGRPIAAYAGDSRGAIAYRALATELWGRLEPDAGHRDGAHPVAERENAEPQDRAPDDERLAADARAATSVTPDRSFALAATRPHGVAPVAGIPGGLS